MLFPQNNLGGPPANDQIEITIIGPGFGEAIVVHIGDGKWVAIDSCAMPGNTVSASLEYLLELGVDPNNVVAIVATHWDDDHIRGLSQLVATCKSAEIIVTDVFIAKDFVTYARLHAKPMTAQVRSGVHEILALMEQAIDDGRKFSFASSNKPMFGPEEFVLSHKQKVQMLTLSPSDHEKRKFLQWVASKMPRINHTRRVAAAPKRNDLSIAVQLMIGDESILLGADLEERNRKNFGWSAILTSSHKRPNLKSSLFKVPHHGSKNGHLDGVWVQMLNSAPQSLIAPWNRGRTKLPTPSDITRVSKLSSAAYLTASVEKSKPFPRSLAVQRTINGRARWFVNAQDDPGMVRCRKAVGAQGNWGVELFGAAHKL